MVTFLGMVTVLGMAMSNIISMMTNDHSRDGGHPWGRLEDLDHFGRVTFQGMVTIIGMITNDHFMDGGHPWGRLEDFDNFREGDHRKNSDHHRGGDHPRDSCCLRDFYHPKG